MNLLSLILIFLGLAIAVSIAYIAWELTGDAYLGSEKKEPGAGKEQKPTPGSEESH